MDNIKNKIRDSKRISDLFIDYLERLNPLIENVHNEDNNQLQKIINNFSSQHDTLTKYINEYKSQTTSFEKDISDIFKLYNAYQNLYLSMENVINYMKEPYMQAENIDESNLSQTYKLETADYLSKIILAYNTFTKKHIEADVSFINSLTSDILNLITNEHPNMGANTIQSVKYIQSQFYQYKNTVSLYASFLQNFINYLYDRGGDAKNIMYQILNMIEEDKNFFIDGNVKNTLSQTHKDIHLKNPPLKRYGLVPISNSMPINKLISHALKKQVTGNILLSSLPAFAKKHKLCIILAYRVVYHPIEYNIRPLVLEEKADEFKQPVEYGITDKIIDRFKTISIPDGVNNKKINKSSNKSSNNKKINKKVVNKKINKSTKKNDDIKWNFSYKIVGDVDKANKYYVFESLDNKTYRILAPGLNHPPELQKQQINNFIRYISSPNKPNRIINYQSVCIKNSINNMFLRRPLSFDTMEQQAQNIDTQIIRNDLYLKISNLIKNTIIAKEYKKGSNLKNNVDINDIIHDDRIKEVFMNVLLSMYNVGAKLAFEQEYSAGKFPFYELLSSYILGLQKLSNRFMKELHDAYNRNPLDDEVFNSSDKMQQINDKLDEILIKLFNTLISDKSNIYSALNYKYLLLNFH